MYGIESISWINFFLVLTIIILLLVAFNIVMRKFLKVEKRKSFAYNHVNEHHKKIDWAIRIGFIVILMLGYFYKVTGNSGEKVWYFETWFIMILYIIISETVRAIMEWKYASNQKTYILTISQLVFTLILLWLTFTTNFFSLF